jgi:hypothetical protein
MDRSKRENLSEAFRFVVWIFINIVSLFGAQKILKCEEGIGDFTVWTNLFCSFACWAHLRSRWMSGLLSKVRGVTPCSLVEANQYFDHEPLWFQNVLVKRYWVLLARHVASLLLLLLLFLLLPLIIINTTQLNSMVWVRERTIPTERLIIIIIIIIIITLWNWRKYACPKRRWIPSGYITPYPRN